MIRFQARTCSVAGLTDITAALSCSRIISSRVLDYPLKVKQNCQLFKSIVKWLGMVLFAVLFVPGAGSCSAANIGMIDDANQPRRAISIIM
jgi:hypothetical protein